MIEKQMPATESELEVLDLIQEECAELVQIISKIRRFGFNGFHPKDETKQTCRSRLESEIGDILTLIDIAVDRKIIDTVNIGKAIESKKERLKIYSNIFRNTDEQSD